MHAAPRRGHRSSVCSPPCGVGRDEFWSGLLAPQPTAERRITDFDPPRFFENPKEVRRTDRVVHIALAAADEAMAQAGDVDVDPDRAGVLFGTGVGGLETLEAQVDRPRSRRASAACRRSSSR